MDANMRYAPLLAWVALGTYRIKKYENDLSNFYYATGTYDSPRIHHMVRSDRIRSVDTDRCLEVGGEGLARLEHLGWGST